MDILEAILNMRALYFTQQRDEMALGMAIYAERMLDRFKSIPGSVRDQIKWTCNRTYERFDSDKRESIELLPEIGDIFHWIWCANDMEKGTIRIKDN
jgi:hypothetical protein